MEESEPWNALALALLVRERSLKQCAPSLAIIVDLLDVNVGRWFGWILEAKDSWLRQEAGWGQHGETSSGPGVAYSRVLGMHLALVRAQSEITFPSCVEKEDGMMPVGVRWEGAAAASLAPG